jgi:hypothetical protein
MTPSADQMKNINNKPRVTVRWNTGSRVHKPKKGKGSYERTRDSRRGSR